MRTMTAYLLGFLLMTAAGAAEEVSLISGLDNRPQVDEFIGNLRSAMAEPVTEPRTEGSGAMRVRLFGHPSLETPPQFSATSVRGGLRYCDWRPYQQLLLDVYNLDEAPLQLVLFARSSAKEYTLPLSLPPGAWTTVRVPVADVQAAGVDTAAMTALGLRLDSGRRTQASRIVLDNVRLTGADVAAIRATRAREDAAYRVRPRPQPLRTPAVESVAELLTDKGKVRRVVDAPVVANPEVLVVGGGLAGVAAVVTAARMGADALLIERAGSLGGMATTGLVPPAFRKELNEGIVAEFLKRLEQVGGTAEMWNPEIMKVVLLDMVRESGAKLMLYTTAVDAIVRDNVIRGVMVEGKSGPQAILSRIVIDCTGDGDVAAWAGAPFEIGRGRDEETQTQTLVFLLGNVDTTKLLPARPKLPDLVAKARAEGGLTTRFAGGAAIQPVILGEHGVANINSINIPQVSGLKVDDLTYSHIEAQREALQLVDFYRKYVPGCEGCYLLQSAEFIGVRESRRIVGEYVLTGEDVLQGATFRDAISRGFYPIDIHAADGTGDAAGIHLSRSYEIPYRCLVPKKIANLLVAGRCISADHVAHGSVRVMGTTMPIGEAAGCAAALCIAKNRSPRSLQGDQIRRRLEDFSSWPSPGTQVPDNLALSSKGTVASADSIFSGNAPDNAIDGLVTTSQSSRWLSDYSDPPHWLQLDFSAPQTVKQVKLYFFDPEGDTIYLARGLEVQVQQEGKWRTVAAVTDNAQLRPTLNFAPVTTGALRVVFTTGCAGDNMIRLREVEVH
ncbi:FAD-dependent oxidoreductase [bacterium]|nr:FAD-dependent oxidoreductase [bacterium]